MKKQFLFFSFLLFSITEISAQWVGKASLTGAVRSGAIAWSLNNKLYVVGGSPAQNLQEYDPVTNVWTVKAAVPWTGYRYQAAGFTINGNGYICGGTNNFTTFHNDLWMYDPIADSWTAMAAFPGAVRAEAFAFSVGDNGYVGAGGNSQNFFKDMYEYNAVNDSWTAKSNFPGGYRATLIGASVGNFGYAGAGTEVSVSSAPSFTNRSDFYKYDPANDHWSQVADIPGPARLSATCFSSLTRIYAGLGGDSQYETQGAKYNDVYSYDPLSDTWDTLALLPTARCEAVGGFVNGQPYITTGINPTATYKDLWTIPAPTATFTGISNNDLKTGISVYPSPVQNTITIIPANDGTYHLRLLDVIGKIVMSAKTARGEITFDCSGLPDGIYTLIISDETSCLTKKVIVNK